LKRSFFTERTCSRKTAISLQFERLEERIALAAHGIDVGGEIFWDANRNGEKDDFIAAPAGAMISLQANPNLTAQSINMVGSKVPYSINGVTDESVDNATGTSFDVTDIDALVASGFELTSPLSNDLLSERSYNTLSSGFPSKPSWIEAVDLDGINGADIIVANFQGSKLTVLLNDGAGLFSMRHVVAVAANSTSIATADFDADGDTDIVIGNRSVRSFDVLINDGTGTFSSPASVMNIPSDNGPSSIVAADVNNDGKIDIVTSNFWDQSVSVYLNQSSVGQVAFGSPSTIDVGPGVSSIEIVELDDQPGSPSLVALDVALDKLLIYNNDGNGNFTYSGDANAVDIGDSRSITAGRIDGDAYDDIAVHDPGKQEIRVYFGDGNGGFVRNIDDPTTHFFADPKTVWFPRGVALADMDGDGDTDLVANLIDGNPPAVLRNDGNRQISDALPLFNAPLDAVVTAPPALADFNGDGTVDIAYSPKWQGGTITVSLRKLVSGQQVVRTNEGNLAGRDFAVARAVSLASTTAGDYDGSGAVNQLDLGVWEANFGRTAGPGMSADSNGSGKVDGSDFLNWQRNFGNVVSPVQASIETAALAAVTDSHEESLEDAVALDANIAWLASANVAFSRAAPLHAKRIEAQLKDIVFSAEVSNDSQLRPFSPDSDDFNAIHTSARSQENLHHRAAYRSLVDTLWSDLGQQKLTEVF